MADFGIGSIITVEPPDGPTFAVGAPAAPDVVVVPVVGPPGTAGGRLVYPQASPAATWTIDHSLGAYPQVEVLDDDLNVVDTDVEHASPTRVVLTFNQPVTGTAILT